MNKTKLIFSQTLMISTGILFGIGVQAMLSFLLEGGDVIIWEWYIPFSIILAGFLCSLATLFMLYIGEESREKVCIKTAFHFLATLAIVSFCGYIFGWYSSLSAYICVVIMYVLIYAFVWISTIWMLKSDEKKINEAIDEIRDEE